jgi:hypothetical protein
LIPSNNFLLPFPHRLPLIVSLCLPSLIVSLRLPSLIIILRLSSSPSGFISSLHHHCRVDLVSPRALNFGVQRRLSLLTLASVACPLTTNICAPTVTLEFGLRTIPSGIFVPLTELRYYSVSWVLLFYQNISLNRPLGEMIYFYFFIRCLSLIYFIYSTHRTHFH